jgi:raffinose/stachyose/melibiose transport system permease protein
VGLAAGKTAGKTLILERQRATQRWRRLDRAAYLNLIALPLLLLVSFFWAYPFLWTISTAFKTQLGAFTAGASLVPNPLDLGNFSRAWITAGFSHYAANSLIYSVSSTLVELTKSALCGYVIARFRFPGRDLLYRIIVLTLFVPVVSIVIPQFVLIEHLGLLNSRLGVILAQSGGAGALYVLLFVGFFENLPQDLFDAARVDGAGFLQTFWLMLPLARPIIAVVVIFQFVYSWNDFTIPLVFTLGQPNLQNLAVGMLSFQGTHTFDWTGFAAGMLMSFTPVLLVFLAFQGYFVRGLAGAVKG